ncbi:MAG: YkgJ family cysteine cluster protein [Myxococcales bacterium]|nr:YkgJ family cysteine cluster protein [Myxococcales bacterium]
MAATDPFHAALDALDGLYEEVDRDATALAKRHAERLQCRRGCSGCCVDDISVSAAEAERIRRGAPPVLTEVPHPAGACAFLDADGACRVYAHRPYVCRTQGLPLRWFERRAGGDVELRDICELNVAGPPLEALPDDDCWLLGPAEARLREISELLPGGAAGRIRLRSLFRRPETG